MNLKSNYRNSFLLVVLLVFCMISFYISFNKPLFITNELDAHVVDQVESFQLELKDGIKIVKVEHAEEKVYYHNDKLEHCAFFRTRTETCDMALVYGKVKSITEKDGCLRLVTKTTYKYFLSNGTVLKQSYTTKNGNDMLFLHQYLYAVDWNEPGWLLSFKSFLITHDLSRSKMILWVDSADYKTVMYKDTLASRFFRKNKPYVEVRVWEYQQEIKGTVLAETEFFQDDSILRTTFKTTYSDIVRILLMHNYGGVWVDNDVWFMKDFYPVAAGIGYQFYPLGWSFNNNHLMMFYKNSPLAKRVLNNVAKFIYTDSSTWPVHPLTGMIEWLYNDALGLLTRIQQEKYTLEKNPAEEWLFPYDLGWLDPMWLYCLGDFDSIKKAEKGKELFELLAACSKASPEDSSVWLLHTRYPKQKKETETDSLLDRTIKIIEKNFDEDQRGKYTKNSQKLIPC